MGKITELITSYENRIATVEELMTKAYRAAIAPEAGLDVLDARREQIETDIRKNLAGSGFPGRKDFDRMLEKVLADSDSRRQMIKEEGRRVREKVTTYLDEHKQLADYLRKQLIELAGQPTDGDTLNAMLGIIRTRYEDASQRLFKALHDFQARLDNFRREQEEINSRLQKLAERGESLKVEDLRQLEAARSGQAGEAGRGLRCGEVDRVLAHFREQFLEDRCY